MTSYVLVSIIGGIIGSYLGINLYYGRNRINPFQMSKMKEFKEIFEEAKKEKVFGYKNV